MSLASNQTRSRNKHLQSLWKSRAVCPAFLLFVADVIRKARLRISAHHGPDLEFVVCFSER